MDDMIKKAIAEEKNPGIIENLMFLNHVMDTMLYVEEKLERKVNG